MINLLPPQLKQDYGYARRNSSLLHTLTAFGLGIVGLAALVVAGTLYLHQSANSYVSQADVIEAELEQQDKAGTEKEVNEISNNLKLAVQVLSKEVLFSKLLGQLAVITPEGASLSGIDISELGGGVDISAETRDYNSATQLQVNMTDSDNKIFAEADIVSISCESGSTDRYPCNVVVRALFAEDNPFLFINGSVKKGSGS